MSKSSLGSFPKSGPNAADRSTSSLLDTAGDCADTAVAGITSHLLALCIFARSTKCPMLLGARHPSFGREKLAPPPRKCALFACLRHVHEPVRLFITLPTVISVHETLEHESTYMLSAKFHIQNDNYLTSTYLLSVLTMN